MGVGGVVELAGEDDVAGDVGACLVGVEADCAPPVGDGGRRSWGGEGIEEVSDGGLVIWVPMAAVPDNVEVDGRR